MHCSMFLSTQGWIYQDKSGQEGSTHSLVMIVNGTRQGSHTDATAGQVHQFTQPVFEAEAKTNRKKSLLLCHTNVLLLNSTLLNKINSILIVLPAQSTALNNTDGEQFPSYQSTVRLLAQRSLICFGLSLTSLPIMGALSLCSFLSSLIF